jgi:hypothetical protein
MAAGWKKLPPNPAKITEQIASSYDGDSPRAINAAEFIKSPMDKSVVRLNLSANFPI